MWNLLNGARVLDLTRLLPGSYATMLLSDLGAEVIKIEAPGVGDWSRQPSPIFGGTNALFANINRNKKSLVLDLKAEDGCEVLLRLAERSAALLEGFRPGVAERLGIGYGSVRKRNPRIVYCSLSGYGQTGPYRDRPGHDINYVGEAGLLGVDNGQEPRVPPLPYSDLAGAIFTALAMAAGMKGAGETGAGAYIDLGMSDTIVSLLTPHFAQMFRTGRPPSLTDAYLLGGHPCYTVYRTSDGKYVTIGALEPKFWKSLCEALGRLQYADHQHTDGMRDKIMADFRTVFASRTRDEWVKELCTADVPIGAVKTLDEVPESEQAEARGLFRQRGPAMKEVGFPAEIHGAHESPDGPAPKLGEHTDEVLGLAGYSRQEIMGLRQRGVVS
jgi:crotonobetainyl-CoA:carnitine CoA-transferase CaiB-like acyl-CoA transferase